MDDRDSGGDRDHSQERWLVSYADFITLMFAFFAILYATSQKDTEKAKEFQESLKRYLVRAGAFGESGQQMNQGTKANSPIEPPIETYNNHKPETVKALDEAETFIETHLTKEQRAKYILDVVADDWGVRITLPAANLFAPKSEKFREDALAFATKLSELVAQTKRKVLVEGHVAANELGNAKSTWEFSSERSLNMLRFIQKAQKLPGDRLAAASFGDSRPIYQNTDPSKNSRLEIVLLSSDMEL